MKRGYIVITGLVLIIVMLSVVQISISNMLSTGGIQLAHVQAQIAEYQKENAILKEKIYSVASLTNIAEKADKLGYVPDTGKSTLVIANPAPLAIKP